MVSNHFTNTGLAIHDVFTSKYDIENRGCNDVAAGGLEAHTLRGCCHNCAWDGFQPRPVVVSRIKIDKENSTFNAVPWECNRKKVP